MISILLSRVITLGLGTLYPAYSSYKAVRTKNVKEYVKWMMYWIVFAFFKALEIFSDLFLAFWFPFYYEIKIIIIIWLISPATKGSSLIYRKFIHPHLVRREDKIDEMMAVAQTQSYNTVMKMVQKMTDYITQLVMEGILRAPHMVTEVLQRPSLQMGEGGDMSDGEIVLQDRDMLGDDINLSEEEQDKFEDIEQLSQPDLVKPKKSKKELLAEIPLISEVEEDLECEEESPNSEEQNIFIDDGQSKKIPTRRSKRNRKQ